MTLFSNSFPEMEIHMSNEPVAILLSAGQIRAFKIFARGKYFVIRDKKVKGIYSVNHKYQWMWGKTPVYVYNVSEHNNLDPVIINELNKFAKTNHLTKVTLKDIKHGSKLRSFKERQDKLGEEQTDNENPITKLTNEERLAEQELNEEIKTSTDKMEKIETDLTEQYQKPVTLPPEKKSYILLDHLADRSLIDRKEFLLYLQRIENHELSFETLVEVLRDKHIVTITEPLDVNVEDFLDDLGSQNPRELAGFVQDLRNNKKGLEDMTAKPIKAFLPAAVILVIGIVIIMAVVVIPANWQSITGGLGGGKGEMFNPLKIFGGRIIDIFLTNNSFVNWISNHAWILNLF